MRGAWKKAKIARKYCQVEFEQYCERNAYCVEDIRSDCRTRSLARKRKKCAEYLRGKGFSFPVIGSAMNRDHTSIIYLLNAEMRERKRQEYLERRKTKTPYTHMSIDSCRSKPLS